MPAWTAALRLRGNGLGLSSGATEMSKSVFELRQELAHHQKHRPNHLEALDPNAPPEVRERWSLWCEKKRNLKMLIQEAVDEETCHWRPV